MRPPEARFRSSSESLPTGRANDCSGDCYVHLPSIMQETPTWVPLRCAGEEPDDGGDPASDGEVLPEDDLVVFGSVEAADSGFSDVTVLMG
jgi:hypothetical protein